VEIDVDPIDWLLPWWLGRPKNIANTGKYSCQVLDRILGFMVYFVQVFRFDSVASGRGG
jgi:hypothetical protein